MNFRPLPRAALILLLLCLSGGFARPAPADEVNQLTPAELAEGWILLFDGESLFGWQSDSKANWHVAHGSITATRESRACCTRPARLATLS